MILIRETLDREFRRASEHRAIDKSVQLHGLLVFRILSDPRSSAASWHVHDQRELHSLTHLSFANSSTRVSSIDFPALCFPFYVSYLRFYSVCCPNTISQKALACTDDRFVDRALRTIEGLLPCVPPFSFFSFKLSITLYIPRFF